MPNMATTVLDHRQPRTKQISLLMLCCLSSHSVSTIWCDALQPQHRVNRCSSRRAFSKQKTNISNMNLCICHDKANSMTSLQSQTVPIDSDGDENARSSFGTREYWDDVYAGRGDFPSDEYSWYYGWEGYGKYVKELLDKQSRLSVIGIGNDPILLDLLDSGYRHVTATDYSQYAIDRQIDLLSYDRSNAYDPNNPEESTVKLRVMDARSMPNEWEASFDGVLEKGALDAIYLSGDGNLERTVLEVDRTLKPGGFIISVSGVVPEELRRQVFPTERWEWIRDGSDDLKAGVFILRKLGN